MSASRFLSRIRRSRGAVIVSIDAPARRDYHVGGVGDSVESGRSMTVSVRTPSRAVGYELDAAVVADALNRLQDDPLFPPLTGDLK